MSNPAIVWNGHTISFNWNFFTFQRLDNSRSALINRSASKITETLNVAADDGAALGFRNFVNSNSTDATLKRNMRQFFQWASQGNAWTFASDSSKTVLTTLASGAASGDTSLVLTSATGVVAGQQYVLRSKTQIQVVKINSIAGAPTVTIIEALDFAFASGSRFRDDQYWPARLADMTNPIVEQPPLHFDIALRFTEDVNSL